MKCTNVHVLTGSLLFYCLATPALAENSNDSTILDTMVVTGSSQDSKLLDTPSSITVLTEKDLRHSGQTQLAELLATIPGVVSQKSGSKTYFSIRGTRGTLSPGAAIYLDGRPLNTGLYRYSKIDTIPLDNIEKIEVVKSPSTAIYGANAARGVILITTKSGKEAGDPLQTFISAEYGSWNTGKGTASFSGEKDNLFYSFTGHALRTDGYRESDEEVNSIDGKLGYNFDGGYIEAIAGYNDSFTRYPTGLDLETAANDPTSPGYVNSKGYFVRPNQTDEDLANIAFNAKYDKNDWLFNASLGLTRDNQDYSQKKDQNSPRLSDRQDDYSDERQETRWDFKVNGGRSFESENGISDTLTAGIDFFHSDFDQERSYPYSVDPSSPGSWTRSMRSKKDKADIDITQRFFAFNVNNDFAMGNFRLLTGARLNYVNYELENKEPASVDKDFNGDVDWTISPSYAVLPEGNLFVSYNHSHYYIPFGHFKSTMEYDHPDAQAEDLEPEIYDSWEAGFKHQLHPAFNYSIILYHTTAEDKMVSFYDGTKFRGYRNAGTSIHKGIELEVDGRPFDWFGYRLNFTTIDAEWDEGVAKAYITPGDRRTSIIDLDGKEVNYVPEYEYSIGFDFYLLRKSKYGSLTASLDIHGFGEQYEDYNNNFTMDSADFVDLKLTWSHGRYELFLNSTNIFDEQWDKYVNSTGKEHDALGGMGGIYPQDGRYIGIGGSIKF